MSLIENCQGNKKIVKMIESAIRKGFRYGIAYIDVLDAALSKEVGVRGGKRYDCASCGGNFPKNQVQVDHIEPVVPLDASLEVLTLEELYSRINCSMSNLQVLCDSCHKSKSKTEVKERARLRKAKKGKLK